jgi:hypothetical protein
MDYRFTNNIGIRWTEKFLSDAAAFEHARTVFAGGPSAVERWDGGSWRAWDSEKERFGFPSAAAPGELLLEVALDCPIQLFKARGGLLNVVYGADVKAGLSEAEAAREFGYCVFHALRCGGAL